MFSLQFNTRMKFQLGHLRVLSMLPQLPLLALLTVQPLLPMLLLLNFLSSHKFLHRLSHD